MTILLWIVLVPFIKKPMTSLWLSKHVTKELDAKKYTYYRFLNNERFNWRKLIYKLDTKVIAQADQIPLQQKVIIADDTICNKTGKKMELVSYHFDHKEHRNALGYQCLQIGCHNGIQLFPLDVSDTELMLQVADQLWEQIKNAMFKSIDLFLNRIEYKYVIKLIDIIEDALFSFKELLTEKV